MMFSILVYVKSLWRNEKVIHKTENYYTKKTIAYAIGKNLRIKNY